MGSQENVLHYKRVTTSLVLHDYFDKEAHMENYVALYCEDKNCITARLTNGERKYFQINL
jgi:hypothetical protein